MRGTGGDPNNYQWSLTTDANWARINQDTGEITGRPRNAQNVDFEVTLEDGVNRAATTTLPVTVMGSRLPYLAAAAILAVIVFGAWLIWNNRGDEGTTQATSTTEATATQAGSTTAPAGTTPSGTTTVTATQTQTTAARIATSDLTKVLEDPDKRSIDAAVTMAERAKIKDAQVDEIEAALKKLLADAKAAQIREGTVWNALVTSITDLKKAQLNGDDILAAINSTRNAPALKAATVTPPPPGAGKVDQTDPRVIALALEIINGKIKPEDINTEISKRFKPEELPAVKALIPATGNPGNPPSGGGRPPFAAQATVACETTPSDLEKLDRSVIDSALLGNWFHPIYDQGTYQRSDGKDGQWSWAHTLCLGKTTSGGSYKNFERNDGRFIFRQDQTTANVNFAVLSTSKHKDQFLQGAKFAIAANIHTMPGTTITIADGSGKVLGSQAVSIGGDLTILLPDDGVTTFTFTVVDPAGTKETSIWFGPYDRSKNINTFDATKR